MTPTPEQAQIIRHQLKGPYGSDLERWAHSLIGRRTHGMPCDLASVKLAREVVDMARRIKAGARKRAKDAEKQGACHG